MDEKIFDLVGNEIRKGSVIAAAFRTSTHAYLRIGIVTGFSSKRGYPGEISQIDVAWKKTSGYGTPPKKSSIEAAPKKFIVLPGNHFLIEEMMASGI